MVLLLSGINMTLGLDVYANFTKKFLYSIETLSSENNNNSSNGEGNLPSGFKQGFAMENVFILSEIGVGINGSNSGVSGGINAKWESHYCCLSSNQYTACNMNAEDPACKNRKR